MTDGKKKATFESGHGYTEADWQEVGDSPLATPEDLAKARPFTEAFPELAEKMRRVRGPQKAPTKVSVTLRLDQDVVERFRASGKGWQSRINEILKRA
jgi:uncharacterized protein (DUF4415 family)